jgi:hypothetical protein
MKKTIFVLSFVLLASVVMAQLSPESKSIPLKTGSDHLFDTNKDDVNIFLWEDFDSGLMPPSGWTLVSGLTPQTWQPGTADIHPPFSGNFFALCRYDDTYVPEGQDEKLYSEIFSTTGLEDAKLGFWFLFSRYWGITPYDNYDLQVLLSTDGGITFSDTIWTELSTDTASWNSWQWVRAEVDLTPYVNLANVQLCFRYVGYDGADAAIDNIEISFVTDVHEIISRPLNLYPNPATDKIYIDGLHNSYIELYDLNGRLVKSYQPGYKNSHLDISPLLPGRYSAVITDFTTKKQSAISFIKQ